MSISTRNSKIQAHVGGLSKEEISKMEGIFHRFEELESVILFGSRAMGNFKRGSDVDLVLVGTLVTEDTMFQVHHALEEETLLPYFFDIVAFEKIGSSDLLKHIDEHGKLIYQQ